MGRDEIGDEDCERPFPDDGPARKVRVRLSRRKLLEDVSAASAEGF